MMKRQTLRWIAVGLAAVALSSRSHALRGNEPPGRSAARGQTPQSGEVSVPTRSVGARGLVKDGKSDYTIVVDRNASPVIRFAAEEFRKYVKQISGAELAVSHDGAVGRAVCIGESPALGLDMAKLRSELAGRGEDGYLMRTIGDWVILLGNSPRATLYSVYHFLEKYLGCGWCAPGDDTVPRRTTIDVPRLGDVVGPPLFPIRQIIVFPYGGELMKKNNLPHTDWLAKNRFNWAHPAPNGPYSWERNKSREVYVPEVKKRGLYLEVGGHTFNTWLPSDKYAKDHSDYYAITEKGARAADATHEAGLCISKPEVVCLVADNMIRWLDENPEVDAVDLWHNDSFTFCRCPQCTPKDAAVQPAAAYTKTYIRFVNRVAELVSHRHPRILVNLLAYAHTTDCPPGAEPLNDHVLVGLCLFPRPSQRTMRPLATSPQKLDSNLRVQISAWRKLARHFYIYEYYTFSDQQRVWSMVSMLCEDIPYLRRCGADGISSDQWGPGWYPLNMYAFGKLMWNPNLRAEEVISDFCHRYYGAAGETMTRYWRLLEEGLRESWNTDKLVDWRDGKRRELIRTALLQVENKSIADRIQATAEMHKLTIH